MFKKHFLFFGEQSVLTSSSFFFMIVGLFLFFKFLFIYFWLRWVFVAAHRLAPLHVGSSRTRA